MLSRLDSETSQTSLKDEYRDYLLFLNHVIKKKEKYLRLKRIFDILASAILLLLLSPILLITALIIKLTSEGPVIFAQKRIGLNSVPFTMFKFRSMKSVSSKNNQAFVNCMGVLVKDVNDSRITFVGKIIRQTSIDELPQLFNVLLGDMSLVGPRPLIPEMLEPFPEISDCRSIVKPGITGLWQVTYRQNNQSVLEMMDCDFKYILNSSLRYDISILFKTLGVVISKRGAI